MSRSYPTMLRIERTAPTQEAIDPARQASSELKKLLDNSDIRPGQRIGILVGSRGIAGLREIISTVVDSLLQVGLKPSLIPAMGSHGGATSAGQTEVLKNLGLDELLKTVPCLNTMDTEIIGTVLDDIPVHRSTACHEVDALLICNRIKPHTKFTGEVQSGLLKMLTVGLGKQAGAETYHRAVRTHSFDDLIREAANCVMSTVPVLGGIAILEGEQKGVVDLRAFPASQIMSEEPLWLQRAAGLMPRLPLEEIDLLIVNEIGKELSGTGLDTNVVGRKFHDHSSTDQDWCRTKLIHIRSLTPATSGNATGIGIAEFTLASAAAEVDWKKTAVNSITAGHPTAAMCPIVMETDREVVDAALNIVGPECRMVHITNTLALQRFWISESCVPQLQKQEPSARIAQDADYYSRQLTGFTA